MRTEIRGNNFHYGNSSRARKVNQWVNNLLTLSMPSVKKSVVEKSVSAHKVYLTKRRLVSAARAAFRSAAADALRVMGYTVVAQNGWVVKKYPDGSFEKIKKLVSQKKNIKFILD